MSTMDSLNNSIDGDFMEHSFYESADSPQEHVPDKKLTNLEPMASVPEGGGNDYKSWIFCHPNEWSSDEVLDFVYFYAHKREIDLNEVRGEAFQEINGEQLAQMTRQQFKTLDPKYGDLFHDCYTELVQSAQYTPPSCIFQNEYQDAMMTETSLRGNPSLGFMADLESPITDNERIPKFENNETSQFHELETANIANIAIGKEIFTYSIDHEDKFADIFTTTSVDGGYESGGSNEPSPVAHGPRLPVCPPYYPGDQSMHPHGNDCYKYEDCSYTVYSYPSIKTELLPPSPEPERSQPSPKPYKRPPGRPRKQRSSEGDDEGFHDSLRKPSNTRGRKAGQTSKGNHLWEFVRDMLKDSECNPRLVRWENKDIGVFKFVKSDEVAKKWGNKKNNRTMNYEKLSRAMRFCRKAGYFAQLPKDGNYPKKLCFKFGLKAVGWEK